MFKISRSEESKLAAECCLGTALLSEVAVDKLWSSSCSSSASDTTTGGSEETTGTTYRRSG